MEGIEFEEEKYRGLRWADAGRGGNKEGGGRERGPGSKGNYAE